MNKPVYLEFSIVELSKILKYQFWFNYVKPKFSKKSKLCYMDADSFIVYIQTNIYKDIAEDNETKFDTSNHELECNSIVSPKGKNKVIGLMKDEVGGKIMTKFFNYEQKLIVT